MGKNKSSFIILLLVMFILFLSWIVIVFNLKGIMFKFELSLLLMFLLIAIKLVKQIIDRKNKWSSLILFFGLNWINMLAIYFITFKFKDVILPIMIISFGYIISLIEFEN